MKVAITGASGFVGSLVETQMKEAGHSTEALKRPWQITGQIDALVHCAAYLPSAYNDSAEANKCLMDNSIATLKLLEDAQKAGVKTFVYLSSGQIYKALPEGSHEWATESSSTFPSSRAPYYLASKLVGDIFVDYFRQSSSMRIVTLRPSSVYGPGMKPKGFLPRITTKIRNGEPIKIEDVGHYLLDLVHVEDVAWLVKEAVTNPSANGIYNVGGGMARPTSILVNILAQLMNKECNFEHPSLILEASHAPLDITKASQELGYKPRQLITGLKSYLESL
jgi:nucleoside-diphosphate-sugar epimerase